MSHFAANSKVYPVEKHDENDGAADSLEESESSLTSSSPDYSGYWSFENYTKDNLRPKVHPRIKKIEAEEMKQERGFVKNII